MVQNRSPTEKFKKIIDHDRRTMRILRADLELKRDITPAPDCSDLIEFLHIEEPTEEQGDAYRDGIRRYFVRAPKLLLTPAWTYEFLDYLHRVIVENIEQFGYKGGFDTFMGLYPHAREFLELWRAGEYRQAEKLYSDKETWVQVLTFTRDEHVQNLLGNPIRRFNSLAQAGRFATVSDYVGDTTIELDASTLEAALRHLQQLRPNPGQQRKNEADARSLATLAWANEHVTLEYFTAVTASRYPLLAFYGAIDEKTQGDMQPSWVSLARSSVCEWVSERVKAWAGSRSAEFLEQGIRIIDLLLEGLESAGDIFQEDTYEATTILADDYLETVNKRGQVRELANTYYGFVREPIFRPIEKLGRGERRFATLSIQQGAAALDPDEFVASMGRARKALQKPVMEMLDATDRFMEPAKHLLMSGKPLAELYRKLQTDFRKDVF